MPRRRTSLKALRQSKKKHQRNVRIKRDIKKAVKKFHAFLTEKNTVEAKTFLPKVFSKLDKAAKKDIFKKNTVNRRKSQLSRSLVKK